MKTLDDIPDKIVETSGNMTIETTYMKHPLKKWVIKTVTVDGDFVGSQEYMKIDGMWQEIWP